MDLGSGSEIGEEGKDLSRTLYFQASLDRIYGNQDDGEGRLRDRSRVRSREETRGVLSLSLFLFDPNYRLSIFISHPLYC